MQNNNAPLCPKCNNQTWFSSDCGPTPVHLHCNFCNVNIGAPSKLRCIDLLKKHNKKNTYIEYYNHGLQYLREGYKVIIDKDMESVFNRILSEE